MNINVNCPCTVCKVEIRLKIRVPPYLGATPMTYDCDNCGSRFLSRFMRKRGGKIIDIHSDTQTIKLGKKHLATKKPANPYDRMG